MKKIVLLVLGLVALLTIGLPTTEVKAERFSGVANQFNMFPYYGMQYPRWRRNYPWKYRYHYWPYFPYAPKSLARRKAASRY